MNPEEHHRIRIANVLKVLANPIRIQIIRLLAEQGELNVSVIQSHLKISQALTSTYLIKMTDHGLVSSTRRGKEIYYSLVDPVLIDIVRLLLR
ncbi:metalloregulator ArsR/SmtB family transcription factor [Spirosoma sp. HMF4905]|uniref:Metalloregulator ArsR/SmtB family transcription factor n=1 Tax=Spirosoma arboris TaxID=2682092 RepID=A0A7K1SB15_9BACT|nr:metalloregulator ArsR/SmtB family transcription factor [Spirosoma arboris]MVM30970.1 metalloregulator ArsR/SmtB family transcription factor [Spirosoma arboris]